MTATPSLNGRASTRVEPATTTPEVDATSPQMVKAQHLEIKRAIPTIRGSSGLISHRFSEKARRKMLDRQTRKSSSGKDFRNPKAALARHEGRPR